MKKVINGKLYNTDTATKIASWDNGLYRDDFGWCDEDLFVTKKGAYFVWGQGGGNSRWAKTTGDGRCGGSSLDALTPAMARQWCEEHDIDADTIAEHFTVEEA